MVGHSLKNTSMSSRCNRQTFKLRPDISMSVSHWKVAGVLHSPNGMTWNLNVPSFVLEVVFSSLSGSSRTWRYPALKSKVENHCTGHRVEAGVDARQQ